MLSSNNIESQINEVLKKYPSLSFKESDYRFTGKIVVDWEDNDQYQIQMDISNFPDRFPSVKETGGRIPKKADRHIYTDNKSCCFTTPAFEQILLKTEIITLLDFVNLIVIKYFQNNSYYELNGHYKDGEYRHGSLGKLQSYMDILSLPVDKVLHALYLRIHKKKFNKIELCCFCGNKEIRSCHLQNYRKLNLVDDKTIFDDLSEFYNLLLK